MSYATPELVEERHRKLSLMTKEDRDALLLKEFFDFDARLFSRNQEIRGGEACLKGFIYNNE